MADIIVSGNGFYTIIANTDEGNDWMLENVPDYNASNGGVCSDDTRMTQDITDGAFEDGLSVEVNGRKYLGNNRVA